MTASVRSATVSRKDSNCWVERFNHLHLGGIKKEKKRHPHSFGNTADMSSDGIDNSESLKYQEKEARKDGKQLIDTDDDGSNRGLEKENGSYSTEDDSNSHNKLVQMVLELNFQNEYLKSQFEGLKNIHLDSDEPPRQKEPLASDNGTHNVKEYVEQIESLRRELLEERQTRNAAEEALKHLRAEYSEADAKAKELNAKLAEEDGSRN